MMERAISRPQFKTVSNQGIVTGDMVFRFCCWLFLVAFAILPDWFGFYWGILFSAKRIMYIICYTMIIFGRERLNRFLKMVKELTVANIFICLYVFVILYTSIYRRYFKALGGELLSGFAIFYLFCYLLKYEIPASSLLKFLRVTLWILCILGLFEYFTQINLFNYLDTTHQFVVATHFRGELRLQGNCHHPIQFGMYISMLFCLSCYDPAKNKLYLFRNPVLFLLASFCIFFSGSRGPFGLYLVTIILICLFSGKDERIKSLIILSAIIALMVIVLILIRRTYAGQWALHMFASVVDSVFDTTLVNDYFSQLGVSYDGSTAYRDALAKAFQLDYLNPLIGRGGDYDLSVVIDGVWIRSGDNNYVLTYVAYAYPGLVTQILLFALCLVLAIRERIKNRNMLSGAILVAVVAYAIGLWYVAAMGTFIYFWMLLAISVMQTKQDGDKARRKIADRQTLRKRNKYKQTSGGFIDAVGKSKE